jgi:hypothetical protein
MSAPTNTPDYYSSLHFWLLTLVGKPSMRTSEWRMEEEGGKFAPFPSIPSIKLLVSYLHQGSSSHVSEAKNADTTYAVTPFKEHISIHNIYTKFNML